MSFEEEKDELYWVVVKDPKLSAEELAMRQKELCAAEARLYRNVYQALNGQEVIVKKRPDGTYALWDWPEADEAKIKEAFYAVEQDPMFGSFCNDRKQFEKAWDEGWAVQTVITLAEDFFTIIREA